MKTTKTPFNPGDIVTSTYRVEPFLCDDVLVVDALSRVGRGKKASFRVRVYGRDRDVSGWLGAADLVLA